jgi:rhodanese-related sulfurtransferase
MSIRRLTPLLLLVSAALGLPASACADTVQGRVEDISSKASTIQVEVDGKSQVVLFGPQTQYVNAAGIKEIGPPDLIEVEHTPGQPATRITKVVFALPPGAEISMEQLEGIRAGNEPFLLVDARPKGPYDEGHIPGSINVFWKDLPGQLEKLPADKGVMVIFYCGGPTCPYTGNSIEIAAKAGHTNLKGFQAGIPAWKKAGKPVTAVPEWVAANLDPHHVIIDVRPASEVAKGHIKGAVSMEAAAFPAMTQKFIAEKKAAKLPGLADMAAPVVVYGETDSGEDVLTAFAEIKKYRYKNAAILRGGYREWSKRGLPTVSGEAPTQITYVKKLKEGAVPTDEFAKLVASPGEVMLLDVRDDKEAAGGILKGATHVPLDKLQADPSAVPKDRPVVAYCTNGARSEMAYQFLKKNGYDKVRFLYDTLTIQSDGSYVFE